MPYPLSVAKPAERSPPMLVSILLVLSQPSDSKLLDHALRQWKQTPGMRIEDAYKWLFQATQGGDHAIGSQSGATKWLDDEWKALGKPLTKEPLLVHLTPDGKLFRIHLRPYRANGGSKDAILEAFVASAKSFSTNKKEFKSAWRALHGRLPAAGITRAQWMAFDKRMRSTGYPAVHHSAAYTSRYRPAYRVVTNKVFYKLFPKVTVSSSRDEAPQPLPPGNTRP